MVPTAAVKSKLFESLSFASNPFAASTVKVAASVLSYASGSTVISTTSKVTVTSLPLAKESSLGMYEKESVLNPVELAR